MERSRSRSKCLCLGSIDKWEEKVGSFLMGRWGGGGTGVVSSLTRWVSIKEKLTMTPY